MLSGIGLFQGIMAKMNWLDQNQQVLSQNVANADTPGYRPKVLQKADFASMMKLSDGASRLTMAATDEGQTIGAAGAAGVDGKVGRSNGKVAYEASPDDNAVILEEQLFKASQNSMDYQLATNLYRRNVGMLRMVLQGSRG